MLGPGGGTVYDLETDPHSPGTLWAAATNGLYKSMDGGGGLFEATFPSP